MTALAWSPPCCSLPTLFVPCRALLPPPRFFPAPPRRLPAPAKKIGDEGAPLAIIDDTPAAEAYFVGLYQSASTATPYACDPRLPAVYTRLSAHVAFLAAAVAPYQLSYFG